MKVTKPNSAPVNAPRVSKPVPSSPPHVQSAPTPGGPPGLVQMKVPVKTAHGTFMETRWVAPAQGGGAMMGRGAGSGGAPKPLPPPPQNAAGAFNARLIAMGKPGLARKGSGVCHMTGQSEPMATGHTPYDSLRHIETARLRKKSAKALRVGRVREFVHGAAHDIARTFHNGADAASVKSHLLHIYGTDALRHATKVAVHAAGHAAARIKSLAQHGSEQAVEHLRHFAHGPWTRLAHTALAHHELSHERVARKHAQALESHSALMDELRGHQDVADALDLHSRAKAAFHKLPPEARTPERVAKMNAISRNVHKQILGSGQYGRFRQSVGRLQKLQARAQHHVESHKQLSGHLDRFHDAVLDHMAAHGHLATA